MINEIFSHINWVDILVLIIIFRTCYVAIQTGFFIELSKLAGLICAVFFGMHYFTTLGDYLAKKIGLSNYMPLEFIDFLSFAGLSVGINLLFTALRKTLFNTFKVEAPTSVNKWGGFILGACRSVIYTGYIVYLLVMSTAGYLKTSVNGSYSGGTFLRVAPSVYSFVWDNLASKFMMNEKINKNALEVEKGVESTAK
jgi:uncharacterized membrane protein required for colicin V production